MASIIVPSRRPWTAQPPASARLDERQVKYIGVYSGQHGTANLATGQALTRGSAVAVRPQKTGMAANQTVVNAGLWCPARNIASVNAKYIALWHGVFVGAVVGSSPKLVGVSNSTTSQSTDLIGLERATNDQITFTVRVAGTDAQRTFSVSSSGWYGKTVTLIGFYEISTLLVWLYVNVDGVITKYSSALSFSGDPAPTIPSTAQFVVGTDVIENPTRSPNVHTALAACFYGSVHNAWIEEKVRNPWSIFAPRRIDTFVPLSGGGSTLNASASGSDVASGSASLSAQVALASVGVSTAGGSATLAASMPLSAVGLSVAAGSAIPSATVTISASGLAQAAGQAGLSASVLAQAAGAALASGNATLAAQLNALATGAAQAGGSANLSGGAAGSLSASGAAIAAGTAVLSVTVGLQASGSALASGTATGSANAPGQVSATGGAAAGGSGVMSARVSITAAGFVQAMGQGAFSATVPLSAFGVVTASGYAHLTVDNGVVMVRAPSGYRSSLIAYNSMRPRQSITIRPISLNTRR